MDLSTRIAALLAFCTLFVRSAMAFYPITGPPVDGRGGAMWNQTITFPVYPNSTTTASWADVDENFQYVEQINGTAGICFGFCLLTLLNIIALTPKPKRGLPLYIFNLLALGTLTARYLAIMITFTALDIGSAYYNIAAGYPDGETARSVTGLMFTIWLPALALIFVVACFYVQAKCVLVLIAMKHKYVYMSIMSYLIGLSICTLILRLLYAAFVTVWELNNNFVIPDWMHTAVVALYTATILSWSLIFTWQVGLCLLNRCKIGAAVDRHEAMAILFMTGTESMIFPMIFTIMQLCDIPWFLCSEFLIMPSVACIIPFGSIWAGTANIHANLQRATQANAYADDTTNAPLRCAHCSNITVINTSQPSKMSVFRSKKTEHSPTAIGHSNSTLSDTTLPNIMTNSDPFGSTSAYQTSIHSSPLTPTDLRSSIGLLDALHDGETSLVGRADILTSRKYGVEQV